MMNLPVRWRISILLVGLLSSLSCSQRDESTPAGDRLAAGANGRNVILITIDTLRADRLGVNGHVVEDTSPSPHIDDLMAAGVQFANAIAPRAITWPSLASVLTGLYPSGHGVFENGYELHEGIPTLATLLSEHGYQTGRFMSNMCRANHLGWDHAFCSRGVDSKINGEALGWLDQVDPTQPVFLWAHYFGAHSPYYNGGDRAAKRLDPGYEGPVAPKKGWLNRIMTDEIPLDDADLQHLDALYDAAVMGSDRFAGELLDALAARGLMDSSVIVFLADHGEDLYDHNQYIYHACSVYQSGLHVPLAFVAPGLLEEGAVVRQSVELMDVTPTVLDLIGVTPPDSLHGTSLVPYLESTQLPRPGRPAFSEYGSSRLHTVQRGDWKLVDNPDQDSPYCLPGAPEGHYPVAKTELYNLADDPLETTNLADQYPERVAELQELIRRRFANLPSRLETQDLPDDLKEELEALGYVAN